MFRFSNCDRLMVSFYLGYSFLLGQCDRLLLHVSNDDMLGLGESEYLLSNLWHNNLF